MESIGLLMGRGYWSGKRMSRLVPGGPCCCRVRYGLYKAVSVCCHWGLGWESHLSL